MTETVPILSIGSLTVSFGGLTALRNVSLDVQQGEVVCVIGPNGAGKSTLMNAVAGGVSSYTGSINFEGQSVSSLPPEKIAGRGISLVPEGRHMFNSLTVEENLRLAGFGNASKAVSRQKFERVLAYFPRLKERISFAAGSLSGGEQQMLAVGRAIMTPARFIMIDEPSLGLAPKVIDQLYEMLFDIRTKENLTLLINEQSSARIMKYADRIYVLRGGEVQFEGSAAQLATGNTLQKAYFGFHPVQSGQ